MSNSASLDRRGLAAGIIAFLLWGVFPLYWHLLKAVPSLQIVAHRMIWCAIFVTIYLLWKQGRGWLRAALARPHAAWALGLSAILIAGNWGLYVWAVNTGHVVETSLGYFINPLVNVVLGVVLLRERLNSAQWTAVILATAGVLWLTFQHGGLPWIALSLALSFAFYGFIRKLVAIDSIPGLGVESIYLFLPALALLVWSETSGAGSFGRLGISIDLLLILSGAVTAAPMIGFAYAARRIPYSTVGVLQYIAPTMQFLCGVLVLGEPFTSTQAIGFAGIWAALIIYAADGLRRARRQRQAALVVQPAAQTALCSK